MAQIGYARVSTATHDFSFIGCLAPGRVSAHLYRGREWGSHRPACTCPCARLSPARRYVGGRKLDRLARSLRQLIDTVEGLNAKQMGFRSLTEALDTTTPGGMMLFHVVGAFAQFERASMQERTRAGLQAARARAVWVVHRA